MEKPIRIRKQPSYDFTPAFSAFDKTAYKVFSDVTSMIAIL